MSAYDQDLQDPIIVSIAHAGSHFAETRKLGDFAAIIVLLGDAESTKKTRQFPRTPTLAPPATENEHVQRLECQLEQQGKASTSAPRPFDLHTLTSVGFPCGGQLTQA